MIDRYGNFYPDYPGQPDPRGWNAMPARQQFSKHVEIIQIQSEQEVTDAVVQPNAPKMFMTRDEQTIIVKSVGPAGYETDYYDRRPPAPKPDPVHYLTREEAEALIDERLSTRTAKPRKAVPADEPV